MIQDLAVRCDYNGPSGTAIGVTEKTLYEAVQPGKTKRLMQVNMGFINPQAAAADCRLVGLVLR